MFLLEEKAVIYRKKKNKFFKNFLKKKTYLFKLSHRQALTGFVNKKKNFFRQNKTMLYKWNNIYFIVHVVSKSFEKISENKFLKKALFRLKYWRSYFFSFDFFFKKSKYFKFKAEKIYYMTKYSYLFFPIGVKNRSKNILSFLT